MALGSSGYARVAASELGSGAQEICGALSHARRAIHAGPTRPLYCSSSSHADLGCRGNLFAFLGLNVSPEVDPLVLQKAYHAIQSRVHPDQANIQQQEQQSSGANADDSVYANAAYETLKDPFLRCRYLSRYKQAEVRKGSELTPSEEEGLMVEHEGAAVARRRRVAAEQRSLASGEPATTAACEPPPDPFDMELSETFLVEMMQANESIFSIDLANNYEEDSKLLVLLEREMLERDAACFHDCKVLWAAHNWVAFCTCVLQWTYVTNALKHIRNLK